MKSERVTVSWRSCGGKQGYLTHTPYLQVCAAFPACTWKPPRTAVLAIPGKERKTPIPKPAIPPFFETCRCCIKPDSSVDQIPLMKPWYHVLEMRASTDSYWQETEKSLPPLFSFHNEQNYWSVTVKHKHPPANKRANYRCGVTFILLREKKNAK